ncbi:hypothetical protein DRQ53_01350 [bacterium]|nr:MAG: hypothetical protein DRQ32_00445 [bacterium]RKZ18212.1 MAG: hypothetical protein DRQ53_01350 [bacterium]
MAIHFSEEFADRPFHPTAYEFVLASLDRTIRSFDPPRHVSGREVLDGLGRDANGEFGPMAAHVLFHWGIRSGPDVGSIVFDLVDRGVLARTEEDRPEDFEIEGDFLDRLEADYYRDHPGFAEPGQGAGGRGTRPGPGSGSL